MICFIDTETTGLDASHHQIWEVGMIRVNESDGSEIDHFHWFLPVDEDHADPIALDIGRFHERYKREEVISKAQFAVEFGALTAGAHWAGAVPSFDEERIRRMFDRLAVGRSWHYHLIDTEALMIGYLHGLHREPRYSTPEVATVLPWRSKDLTRAIGVNPDAFDAHTALGDCEWALACWKAVTDK